MLRIIIILSVLGIIEFQKCCGDSIQDDWRRQGFYRPRRNFPSQSQNDNSFQPNHHSQSQNFRPEQVRTGFGENSENQFGVNTYQNSQKQKFGVNNNQPQYSFRRGQTSTFADLQTSTQNQGTFGASYQNAKLPSSNRNSQSRNTFGFNSQSSFRSEYHDGGQNTVRSRDGKNSFSLSQNLQAPDNGQNSFKSSFSGQPALNSYNSQAFGNFGQKVQAQNPLTNFHNQNTFSNFGSNFAKGQNYQTSGYLPPKPFKAPEYLPPDESKTTSTTRRPLFTTTTTKRPFFTISTTRKPLYTTTKRTFFTTSTTKRPFFTTTFKIPFFTTTTTKRPFFTTTTKRPISTTTPDHQEIFPDRIPKHPFGEVSPAMAMIVPPEPEDYEDEIVPDFRTTTKRPIDTTTPDHQEIFPDRIPKHPFGEVSPAMAMIVPPEPEDDEDEIVPDFRTTTNEPAFLPAMAMVVPPEEDDPTTISTTILVTTPSTKITTPSSTIFTTPSTSTTLSTTSSTNITSPSTTKSTTLSTPSTTLTTPDFNRNQEEETIPTTKTTTVILVTKATPTTTPPVLEQKLTPTTKTTTVIPITKATSTTTKRPFIGIGYLPPDPKTTSTTTGEPGDTQTYPAAGADEVPPEPKCNPLDPSTWPTLYEQRQYGELPCAPVRTTTPRIPTPAPARAEIVPPEPECDPLDPSTWPSEIDQREFGETPCAPSVSSTTTSTTSTTSTTPSTTTSPSTTISTTPSTTTSTTPSTTTSTTTTTTTTPSTTTTSTTPSITTTSTTPTTTSTTTTTTTPSTTTSTTPSTTTSTTPSTTTSTTPITTTSTTTSTTPSTTTSTTPSTTTSTTTTTIKPPYIGREYLPPTNHTYNVPPSPARAEPVPPEPECDPLDPSTWPSEFDQRYHGESPCAPNITTTKPPYVGLTYLPPDDCIVKKRKRRSSEVTLRLGDVKGTPRPVWYAGIYRKITDPYFPICGGSIVREDVVISAAHCFWDDVVGLQPAHQFAVAASKIYKPWKDPMDKKAQKSDVLDIKIPARFLGVKTSFQEDIAILKLATPFKYTRGVRPICVDFDDEFDRQQMKAGHRGTIAGWGLTDSVGTPTQRLLWLELPYIEIEKCIRDSEDAFLKYITCDKVCAGENDTGKALCKGDSGGGLAFWSGTAEHATPYLRGIASTAPSPHNAECNVYAYGSFTHVRAHRTFLRDHVSGIENCQFWE
ncbi:mucin-2-like [Cydia pomonella]|uniref:mucin-2-like n=1 Tax=Cydia pomonella TaxID=82600 RepID=UPI002ADE4BAF|nr:mucin-2-like [Cydia pomonella]